MDKTWLILLLAVGLVLGAVFLRHWGREPPPSFSLDELQARVIPAEGAPTAYGVAIGWENVQLFADWYYDITLTAAEERVLVAALGTIPTPCCDDTRVTRCCCEQGGLICNLVRSARGLGAWLIREKGFDVPEVRASVEEWLRFVHPQYYLAQELRRMGLDPAAYGLPTRGACYRGWCEVPLRQGGCGGMGLRVKL